MYMSNSTLEKLLGIMQNKSIDAGDGEQSKADDSSPTKVKRVGNVPSWEEVRKAGAEKRRDDEEDYEDDGDVDREKVTRRGKVTGRMVKNGIKLSGPVTDL